VIGGDVAIGNHHSVGLPIFGKFPEQRFALFWIEVGCCFREFRGFLIIGELPKNGFALFRIDRDLLLRGCFVALGS